MSFNHVDSFFDLERKSAYGKYRRSIGPLAAFAGTAIFGLIVLSGLLHLKTLPIAAPMTTSISVRPDFPVSTYVYERGAFSWFIGVAAIVTTGLLALGGLATGCVAVSGGLAIAGCTLAAVSVVYTVISSVQSATQSRQLRLAQQAMIYMDYADHSAKRTIDPHDPFDHTEFLHSVFGAGSNYSFAGMITEHDKNNGHLVGKNNGAHVPVFSFTTPHGTPMHHLVIENPVTGGKFHRFGFDNTLKNSRRASTDPVAGTEEYFTSGGIDALDCWAGEANHLTNNDLDNQHMQEQIQCAVPNFDDVTELAVQIYDATTQETIAAGRVAPFDASNGNSELLESDYSSCPYALQTPAGCGTEDDTD